MNFLRPFRYFIINSFLCSVAQLSHYLADALHGGETCGHQWQAQHILYHAHLMQHGLYSCRVAIYKEELEELGKLVVYAQR